MRATIETAQLERCIICGRLDYLDDEDTCGECNRYEWYSDAEWDDINDVDDDLLM